MESARKRLVVVPHTHWDREWYRTHEQFRYRLVELLDDLLELLESEPGFRHFTLDGQAIVVEDYLEVRPAARERIAKLVGAGRLLVGPWTVLPDEWLVSGEALIRNLRMGLESADALGGGMRLGYVPDQFGHVGQLPQIFAGFGFETAVLWRGVGANVRETLFDWEAPDGTRLLTVYLARSYSNGEHLPEEPEALAARLRAEVDGLARRSRIDSLLLMNGTDHAKPNPRLPEMLARVAEKLPDVDLEIGTLPEFAARARAEAPDDLVVHHGELRSGLRSPLLPGCASARMPQKIADFENDRLLTRYVEPLAAWVAALGGKADTEMIRTLWRVILENHPHDSICGCSIDAVHDQMDTRFARVAELGGAHLDRLFGDLAGRVGVPGEPGEGEAGLVVWNPNPTGCMPIEAIVELDTDAETDTNAEVPGVSLYDGDGREVPADCEWLAPAVDLMAFAFPVGAAGGFLNREYSEFLGLYAQRWSWRREGTELHVQLHLGEHPAPQEALRADSEALREATAEAGLERFSFRAVARARVQLRFVDTLPGFGLAAYRVCARAPGVRGGAGGRADARPQNEAPSSIENEFWRVAADSRGRVSLERVGGQGAGLQVEDALRIVSEGDRGDEYNFDPVPGGEVVDRPARIDSVHASGHAPRSVLCIDAVYSLPAELGPDRSARSSDRIEMPVSLSIALFQGVDRIDLDVEVDHAARDHRLRLHCAAPFEARRFEVESAFEVAEREVEPQQPGSNDRRPAEYPIGSTPQRRFATLVGEELALTVANRGAAEVEALRVSDDRGELALTLLRAVGWLSRGDLVLRPAPAGPILATPGAQVPGHHRLQFSLRWHAAGSPDRSREALRYAYPAIARQTELRGDAELRDGATLLDVGDPEVIVSAIEPHPNGGAMVRVYNSANQTRTTTLSWRGQPNLRIEACDLSGRSAAQTAVDVQSAHDGVRLSLGPARMATLRIGP